MKTTLAERQAALRLALQDALRHTDPTTLNSEAFTVFSKGVSMLGWFTFSEADEERWLQELLEAGWCLAPAADEKPEE